MFAANMHAPPFGEWAWLKAESLHIDTRIGGDEVAVDVAYDHGAMVVCVASRLVRAAEGSSVPH
ncbi:hypothetical protein B7435_27455 [Mycolicibacterium peregrinum]|nr:hypothetical protein B7435_27455 [Mycolicibacterium peregrinum]